MADGDKKAQPNMSSDERFKYIGFEVFPGKAGDIFKNDAERKSLIEKVMNKLARSDGEVRDKCTLVEERVSSLEKGFLTLASVLMLVSLLLPWFSGYVEIVNKKLVPTETTTSAAVADSTAPVVDSVALQSEMAAAAAIDSASQELAAMGDSTAMAAAATKPVVPPGMTEVTEISQDKYSITGFGALFSMGTYGSMVFSSGFALMLTGVLMIVFMLSSIVLGIFDLYVLWGVKKKTSDEHALYLKKMLRLNWLPIFIWLGMFVLSIVGASYGFATGSDMLVQVGDSYSMATFVGLGSVGMYVALAGFLICALKGKEI